jgi:hypothetical protein
VIDDDSSLKTDAYDHTSQAGDQPASDARGMFSSPAFANT